MQCTHAQVSSRFWRGCGHSGSGKCLLKSSLCRKCKRDAKDHVHKKVGRQPTNPSSSYSSPHHSAAARRYKVVRTESKRPPGIRYAFVRRAMRRRQGQNAYKVNRKRKFTSWRRTTSSACVFIYIMYTRIREYVCMCLGVFVWVGVRARLFPFDLRIQV